MVVVVKKNVMLLKKNVVTKSCGIKDFYGKKSSYCGKKWVLWLRMCVFGKRNGCGKKWLFSLKSGCG